MTRRSFYLGTSLLLLGLSLVFGFMLYVGTLVESATGGWGMSLRFFRPPFLAVDGGGLGQVLALAVPFVLVGAIGMVLGVVYQRWRGQGLYTAALVSIVVVGGAVALVLTVPGAGRSSSRARTARTAPTRPRQPWRPARCSP